MTEPMRTVSTDPGLMTMEQLLDNQKGVGRKTLEQIIAKNGSRLLTTENISRNPFANVRKRIKGFLDDDCLKISVSIFSLVVQLFKSAIYVNIDFSFVLFFDSNKYDDFMTVITIFVLFGDWVRVLVFKPSTDFAFSFFNNAAFFLFITEMILNSWAKSDFHFSGRRLKVKGYMFSFFFWLDLMCIFSMVPDLKWMSSHFGLQTIPGSNVGAKAGKAGRIGAKTGRVVRMVRLIRLVKLYKVTSQRNREKKVVQDLNKLIKLGRIGQQDMGTYLKKITSSQKQSKVGAELSDIITRRVIVAVLLMLLIVPLLSYSSSNENELEATAFIQSVNIKSGFGTEEDCEFLVTSTKEYVDLTNAILGRSGKDHQHLIALQVHPQRCNSASLIEFKNKDLIERLREEEIREFKEYEIIEGVHFSTIATFNMKSVMEDEAWAGIHMTIFVVFMLVTLSSQFNGDAQKLVLAPIESMMEMVNMVADDPLEDYDFNNNSRTGEYETRVVQVAIQKITTLLRVGFGVAGAEIISKNMAVEGKDSAVLNPMIPGRRIYAIFGFCDIHAFDLCTEQLEDEIMTFINSVARIVHDEVTRWGGLCNKNLGNAFLMVWRIGDESALQEITGIKRRKSKRYSLLEVSTTSGIRVGFRNLSIDLRRIPGLDMFADKALIGFLKVLVEINRDKQVIGYRYDKRLTGDSGNFSLRMGFGLHAGWAIEGAVGSLQKVDATYLSPHVNMAARMEAASRQFGLAILMTERFFELMSTVAQEYCRKIDVVTVKGSAVPMPIYTYDAFQNQVFPMLRTPKYSNLTLEEVLKKQADEYHTLLWERDQDLVQLRCLSTNKFREIFQEGLSHYLGGSWSKAKEFLVEADAMMKEGDSNGDGPSQVLLKYMMSREWICPSNWKGFRPLTSK